VGHAGIETQPGRREPRLAPLHATKTNPSPDDSEPASSGYCDCRLGGPIDGPGSTREAASSADMRDLKG
jgi:hypothetical protein